MKLFVMKNYQKNYAKTSIRKFEERNVHSSFVDNIWVADFKGFRFFLCVIDINRKYTWVIPLKDTKWTTITKAFKKFFIRTKPRII